MICISVGTVISFALARHMIETRNKGDLIKLLIEMSRGPPHIQGEYFAKERNLLKYEPTFRCG